MSCLRGASFVPLTLSLSPQLRFVAGEGTLVVRTILLIGDFLFDLMKPRAQTMAMDIDVGRQCNKCHASYLRGSCDF